MDNVIDFARTAGTARDQMISDLTKSGLAPADLNARVMENLERAATGTNASTDGYVLPYYDITGKPLSFYRVRLFNSEVKYKQQKSTPNHVYFPRGFLQLARSGRVIYITEGEKKAALACKMGYPVVALGGVDAWRNRIISLSSQTELNTDKERMTAKLGSGDEITEDTLSSFAIGMQDLIDLSLQLDATLIIVFDSDRAIGMKPEVQRAAASLGFELRSKGVPFTRIRQLILPWDNESHAGQDKLGLDDYLLQDNGTETFNWLTQRCLEKRSAFPRHPSIQDYIGRRLQKAKLSRKEVQHISLAIMCELDTLGLRLRSPDEKQMYYFDFRTRRLMKAGFLYGKSDEAHDTPFGSLLYQRFGLGAADQRVLEWLSAQFNGEPPIESVSPERVIARPVRDADSCHLQISDGEYVTVTAEGLTISDNGANGILFEAGHVKPIDAKELARSFQLQSRNPLVNQWGKVLDDVRLLDHDETQTIISLLYYLSPWLYRWRGTQLPVELVLGESGSGKSTLMELRLDIITGIPRLRNRPTDAKDWYAAVTNAGGLLVVDNVQLTDKSLRDSISDELCRMVTEPYPAVEMRKYYTNAELVRFPVRTVFAMTAIRQPFQNQDILQRSIILELDKPADPSVAISYNMEWSKTWMDKYGGRVGWVAHHLLVLQRFFQAAKTSWNPHYKAKHRLINLEQALVLMGKILNIKGGTDWIPDYLGGIFESRLEGADWTFAGLKAFVDEFKERHPYYGASGPYFTTSDVEEWSESEKDFMKCELLTNARKLGHYMVSHKSTLANALGIVQAGKQGNRMRYKVLPLKPSMFHRPSET